MNVLDLAGPEFLAFYIIFLIVVATAVWAAVSLSFGGAGGSLIADPYRVAWLRGGAIEVARLAVVSLASRQLVTLPRPGVIAPAAARMPADLNPVERAILVNCQRPEGKARPVLRNSAVRAACRAVADPLVAMGLAPTANAKLARAALCAGAGFLVLATGAAKLDVAAARGHSNVRFLILLMIAAAIVFLVLAIPRPRTPEGRRMLADMRRLLQNRRAAVGPQSPMGETLLMAGVFGAAGLAGAEELQRVYYQALPAGSSGSSCGGSDGGGGCGGCGGSGC